MNRYYSNQVDSDERLPLLRPEAYNGVMPKYVHKVSSEGEVREHVLHIHILSLPHSIMRGDN